MLAKSLTATIAVVAILCTSMIAGDDVSLKDVKCILNPKGKAKADKFVEYKDGKVFFCCGNCPKKFKENTEKFATKANHQLVATGQYKQTKCPLTGRPVNEDKTVKIGGVSVGLCCGGCKGKVDKAEDDAAKAALVFNDKAFKKGFAKPKKKD